MGAHRLLRLHGSRLQAQFSAIAIACPASSRPAQWMLVHECQPSECPCKWARPCMPMPLRQPSECTCKHASPVHALANMPAQCVNMFCLSCLKQGEPPKAKEVVGERPWLLTWFLSCSLGCLLNVNYGMLTMSFFVCMHMSCHCLLHSTPLPLVSTCQPATNYKCCHYLQAVRVITASSMDGGTQVFWR